MRERESERKSESERQSQEHKYTGFEGTREILEVLQHLNEAEHAQKCHSVCICPQAWSSNVAWQQQF